MRRDSLRRARLITLDSPILTLTIYKPNPSLSPMSEPSIRIDRPQFTPQQVNYSLNAHRASGSEPETIGNSRSCPILDNYERTIREFSDHKRRLADTEIGGSNNNHASNCWPIRAFAARRSTAWQYKLAMFVARKERAHLATLLINRGVPGDTILTPLCPHGFPWLITDAALRGCESPDSHSFSAYTVGIQAAV